MYWQTGELCDNEAVDGRQIRGSLDHTSVCARAAKYMQITVCVMIIRALKGSMETEWCVARLKAMKRKKNKGKHEGFDLQQNDKKKGGTNKSQYIIMVMFFCKAAERALKIETQLFILLRPKINMYFLNRFQL